MADRELDQLRARLATIQTSANKISAHLADLHALAYERTVTDNEPVDGHPWPPPGVEHHGNDQARTLWRHLDQNIAPIERSIRALDWAVGNLLSQGASPDDTRGWREQIQRREFREALRQQRLRQARGEYVPARTVDQPNYPGTSST